MVWFTQVLEIAIRGEPSGFFRMTAKSDEDGGGPHGCDECFHTTREEAEKCSKCDEYVSKITGFPSRKDREDRKKDSLFVVDNARIAFLIEKLFSENVLVIGVGSTLVGRSFKTIVVCVKPETAADPRFKEWKRSVLDTKLHGNAEILFL